MRDMSKSGASVGVMSHKHERYESEWSKLWEEKKRVRVNRNITPLLNLKFLLKI